jgi:P-type Ca2+ transporter type 2C
MSFHLVDTADVFEQLQTSKLGLSPNQAAERLAQYGKNELTEKKKKAPILLFLQQFTDVMVLILLIAALISFAVGDLKDAAVILIIVLLNAIIGFVQEYRAEKAMEALKKMAVSHATVRRGGQTKQIAATDLVPGDLVLLEAGMSVPADIRLTETHSLRIDEAALTGESHAVEKNTAPIAADQPALGDRFNMAYKTTLATYGRGEGIVVATGMQTEMGRIAAMLQEEGTKTPLQQRLADFGKRLSIIVICICVIIYFAGLLRGEDPIRMLLTAISVAVAAIPEALPAVITIALAVGASRMVKKNALIRKLPAVETLGSVTYICSDKTGTITQNKMTVTDVWIQPNFLPSPPFSAREWLLMGMELNHDVHAHDSQALQGDPTEIAMVVYARSQPDFQTAWQSSFIRQHELPFDSDRKRMSTIFPYADKWLVVTKGAVESILPICPAANRSNIEEATLQFAEQGKRVLAFACAWIDKLPSSVTVESIEQGLQFIGLVAMIDPPRQEAIQAIADCHAAGICPVMITGDHPLTAKTIATTTGILRHATDRVMTGAELASISEENFENDIEHIKVYARVSPEQKLQIVTALQKKNHFVAMTGDGVNDAPALKRANIGIAMGITGTDVSKEAAHMILLDDNFATIIKAVREGRRIFDNIRKFIKYTMTSNSGEVWTIFLAPFIGLPIPLLPIHILWINLVTDGLPGLAFAAEQAEANILKRPPRKTNESIFGAGVGFHILWVGLLMGAVCIATQAGAIYFDNEKWMTMVFTVLSLSQMGHAMAIRSDWQSLFTQGIFSNKQLIGAVLLTLILQIAVIYTPALQSVFRTQALSLTELAICIGLSSLVFWAVEMEKWLKRKKINRTPDAS